MPDLVAGALRRQRLIERTGDEVWAMFRIRTPGRMAPPRYYTSTRSRPSCLTIRLMTIPPAAAGAATAAAVVVGS